MPLNVPHCNRSMRSFLLLQSGRMIPLHQSAGTTSESQTRMRIMHSVKPETAVLEHIGTKVAAFNCHTSGIQYASSASKLTFRQQSHYIARAESGQKICVFKAVCSCIRIRCKVEKLVLCQVLPNPPPRACRGSNLIVSLTASPWSANFVCNSVFLATAIFHPSTTITDPSSTVGGFVGFQIVEFEPVLPAYAMKNALWVNIIVWMASPLSGLAGIVVDGSKRKLLNFVRLPSRNKYPLSISSTMGSKDSSVP